MTELDYLKLAAKAAGLEIDFTKAKGAYYSIVGTQHYWNAGLSDGNAFRLASACHLMVDMDDVRCRVLHYPTPIVSLEMVYPADASENARMHVNRVCIVRAAAEIQLAREREAGRLNALIQE